MSALKGASPCSKLVRGVLFARQRYVLEAVKERAEGVGLGPWAFQTTAGDGDVWLARSTRTMARRACYARESVRGPVRERAPLASAVAAMLPRESRNWRLQTGPGVDEQ